MQNKINYRNINKIGEVTHRRTNIANKYQLIHRSIVPTVRP